MNHMGYPSKRAHDALNVFRTMSGTIITVLACCAIDLRRSARRGALVSGRDSFKAPFPYVNCIALRNAIQYAEDTL